MTLLAPTMQAFFTDRMINQKNASPRTICAYRDTMRLLLTFATETTGTPPSRLDIEQLDAPLIGAFLDHLEHDRGNSPRTRNARLAAIHSLYRYAALRHPEHAHTIARVIEIPQKTHERATVCHLEPPEIKALLAAPDRSTWLGRRDHALLLTAIQTGLRCLRARRACLQRHLDIRRRACSRANREGPQAALHPTERRDEGRAAHMARRASGHARGSAVPQPERRVARSRRGRLAAHQHAPAAAHGCPSLGRMKVTPHVLRHTCAMMLRAVGVDLSVIALWLGHESIEFDPDLLARRPCAQGEGPGTHRAGRHASREIPTPRHPPGVPRRPLIIRSSNRYRHRPRKELASATNGPLKIILDPE